MKNKYKNLIHKNNLSNLKSKFGQEKYLKFKSLNKDINRKNSNVINLSKKLS
jgi:hypothetical protein